MRIRTPKGEKTSPFRRPQVRKTARSAVEGSRRRFADREETALAHALALPRRTRGNPAMARPHKARRFVYGLPADEL